MSLPSLSVRRPILVSMIFLGILVIGLIAFTRLPLDMFPDIESPMISVITVWKGASATDVESKVTKILEDKLAIAPELDEMSSISQDNVSVVSLKFRWGANLDEAANDVRALSATAQPEMPDEVDDPLLFRINFSQLPILMLSVTTNKGDIARYSDWIEDNIVNDLQRVPGVAAVTMFNQQAKQLQVNVDRRKMESYGLSLQQIEYALKASNLTLPAGTIETGRTIYTVRAPGEYENEQDVRNVIVGQNRMGALVYLKDVATVSLGMEERVNLATANGLPSMMLMVQRESGTNTVEVAEAVMARMKRLDEKFAPSGFRIVTVMDMSESIVHMIASLSEAVYLGGAIVLLVVIAFLRRIRASMIVALSIPTCLVAGFAMLALGGYTLNVITLASLSIAVGLVVDDSIVTVDNIMRHLEQGKSPGAAAALGVEEVQGAVTAATLTNAAIFMPVLFVGGIIGIMFKEMAFVIIVTLMLSLAVAVMLVPALSQWVLHVGSLTRTGTLYRLSERMLTAMEKGYGRVIRTALHNKVTVVLVVMGLFVASLGLTRVIGADFMPNSDGGMITITAELPIGTNVEHTFAVAREIESIVKRRIPEVLTVSLRAGAAKGGVGSVMGGRQGPNIASFMARVVKRSDRNRTTFDMAEAIRPEIAAIPGLVSLQIDGKNPLMSLMSGGVKPFTLEIYSSTGSINDLRNATRNITELVDQTPGVVNVTTDVMDDNPEVQISIDRLAAARMGVPVAVIAATMRTSIYGNAVTRYRGGDEDIDLFLQLQKSDRDKAGDILDLTVPSLSGEQIRLSTIARVVDGRSPLEVRRLDKHRLLRVMADVRGRAIGDVANDVEKALAADRANGKLAAHVTTRFAGDVKEQRAMMVDLTLALLLAILLVYMVMAAEFESVLDPLVVMFSVPFGITGSLLALPLTGTTLSITSFVGMIMTVGIVVKNAIVLVDYIKLMRDRGLSLEEAIRTGGERRLRPVTMTALAILGGMLPLAIATGEGSEIWKPMAIAVIGGVLVSTVVTLVLIPCVYALTERWRKKRLPEKESTRVLSEAA
ncbi:MAG: efflux RND transporter permease subunit [Deltaproteobacteria bacterium]|nr:efflux RND transporter permease subunit [Deltaproteobacteria bacterium]